MVKILCKQFNIALKWFPIDFLASRRETTSTVYRVVTICITTIIFIISFLNVEAAEANAYLAEIPKFASLRKITSGSGDLTGPGLGGEGSSGSTETTESTGCGVITAMVKSTGIDGSVWEVKILEGAGWVMVTEVSSTAKINDIVYSGGYYGGEKIEFDEIVPMDVPIKYLLNSAGKVSEIEFDNSVEFYTDVIYDIQEKIFKKDGKNIPTLPIFYYNYDKDFLLLPLDNQHKYNISVYDCGIIVEDYNARDNMYAIKKIQAVQDTTSLSMDTVEGMTIEYYYELRVNFEIEAENIFLKYQLLNSLFENVEEKVLDYEFINIGNGESAFKIGGRKDKNEEYTLKFWLQDQFGNRISPEYINEYNVSAKQNTEYKYRTGIITSMGYKVGVGGGAWDVKIECDDSWIMIAEVASVSKINDIVYSGGYYGEEKCGLDEIVPIGVPIKFLTNSTGRIMRIRFEQEIKMGLTEWNICENSFSAKFIITNFTSTTKRGRIFICRYKNNGIDATSKSVLMKPLKYEEIELNYEDIDNNDVIKIFFWSENMTWFMKPKEYTIGELLSL